MYTVKNTFRNYIFIEIFKDYIYNTYNYLPEVLRPFFSISKLLFFCRDSAVFIFPTPLADIQRPNWKSAQGSQLLTPDPSILLL